MGSWGIKVLILIFIVSLFSCSGLAVSQPFTIHESFSSGINQSFSLVRVFYPVSSWKPYTPIYSLGGSVNWYLVTQDPNGNNSYILNQTSSTTPKMEGVHTSMVKNSGNVTRVYLAYSPQNLTYFGPNSSITFNCDAFSDGGQPYGYFMWTTKENKSVFISVSNINVGGDSACNSLVPNTFGREWLCLDNFENICNAAAYSGTQVRITYDNLTAYMINSSYYQDITSLGFMWQVQSGTGTVEGGDIYNLTVNAWTGTNDLPLVNLSYETDMIYQDDTGVCTMHYNFTATDPEADQIYYSSSSSVSRVSTLSKNFNKDEQVQIFPGMYSVSSSPNYDDVRPYVVRDIRGRTYCEASLNDTGLYFAQIASSSNIGFYNLVLNPHCSADVSQYLMSLQNAYSYPILRMFLTRVTRPGAYVNVSFYDSEFREVIRFRVIVQQDGLSRNYSWLNTSGWVQIRTDTFNPTAVPSSNMAYNNPIDWTIDLDDLSFMSLCPNTTFAANWIDNTVGCTDTQITNLPTGIMQNMTIAYIGFTGAGSLNPVNVYPRIPSPAIRGLTVSGSSFRPGSWTTVPFEGIVQTETTGVYSISLYVTDSYHINFTEGGYVTKSFSFSCLPSSMGSDDMNARQDNAKPHGLWAFLSFLYKIGGIFRRMPNIEYVIACYGAFYVLAVLGIWASGGFKDIILSLTISSVLMVFISFCLFPIGYLATSIVILSFSLVPQILPYFMGRSNQGGEY